MKKAKTLFGLVALILIATVAPINAQPTNEPVFTRKNAMIAMRDGVRLYTQVYLPTKSTERFPILLLRTPYGLGDLSSEQLAAALPELVADGYIIVRQDIRGRFKSEGQFVMLRQPRDPKDKQAIDESTDTFDTIDEFGYLLRVKVGGSTIVRIQWLVVSQRLLLPDRSN